VSQSIPDFDDQEEQSETQELFQKPRAGVYTMLLFVSFCALLTGIFCLHKEMESYNFDFRARGAHGEHNVLSADVAGRSGDSQDEE